MLCSHDMNKHLVVDLWNYLPNNVIAAN